MKVNIQKNHNLLNAACFIFSLLLMSCNGSKKMPLNTTANNYLNSTSDKFVSNSKPMNVIDFYAYGPNEEWELRMDNEQDFVFKTKDGYVFSTPAVKEVKAQDANVSRYRAVVESGEMIIQLYKQECISKSGKKFPYQVKVEIKRGIDKVYKEFNGCGNFVFDERIHDIWVLQKLNGKEVSGPELPYIECNTTENRVMGKTGCNNFSGKADFKGNKITFGPLAVTRKFCQNAIYENEFLKAVSPSEMEYTIENRKLILSLNGKEVLVFKKVD